MSTIRRASGPSKRWWQRPAALLGLSAAAFGVAWAAYDVALRPAPVAELIPEYVPGFAVVDARHVWDLTADVRNTKEARKALATMEKELHISVAEDILPWAGEIAVAPLSLKQIAHPDIAVLIQVRNPAQYYLTMTRLRTRLEREATPYWKGTGYHGVPLRYAYIGKGKDRLPVSTAWLKGWVVIGAGNGSTKRVIDAWQGRKRTIATNSAWGAAVAGISKDAPVRIGMNLGMVYRELPMPGVPKELVENAQFVFAEAIQDTDDGIRLGYAGVPTSAGSRALMKKFADTTSAPSDGLMDRLPAGTFAAMATGNPGAWWDIYAPMFARMSEGGGVSAAKANSIMKPISDLVHRMTGGVAIGVAHDEKNSWGVSVIGDCGDATAAEAGADDLSDFVESRGARVEIGPSQHEFSLQMPATPVPGGATVAPGWSVDGSYLALSSNKAWLSVPPAATPQPLPEEARGAPFVGRGDFSFIPAVMEQASAFGGDKTKGETKSFEKGWQASGLDGAQWATWGHYRDDGSSTGAFVITHWAWRDALRNAVNKK